MAIPDFQTLMLPVLRTAEAGEVKISDVVELLANEFQLTEEERSELLPSGKQTTFANRVHWAKSYLGKAALVSRVKNSLPYLRCLLTWVAGFANKRGDDERKTEGATDLE